MMSCSGLNKKYDIDHVSGFPQMDLEGVSLKAQQDHHRQLPWPDQRVPREGRVQAGRQIGKRGGKTRLVDRHWRRDGPDARQGGNGIAAYRRAGVRQQRLLGTEVQPLPMLEGNEEQGGGNDQGCRQEPRHHLRGNHRQPGRLKRHRGTVCGIHGAHVAPNNLYLVFTIRSQVASSSQRMVLRVATTS